MALISQEMISTIGRTYIKGQEWMNENGIDHCESVDVALAAETYRYFWKPKPVKTVLLLPRDSQTCSPDLGHKVKSGWLKLGQHTSPNAFVRTPYCLGYGEPEIVPTLDNTIAEKNSPIWHTLAELVQRNYSPSLDLLPRLEHKARILHELHRLGIWITHPSLFGDHAERHLIAQWWSGPGQFLQTEAPDALLIAFGRGLYDDLIACNVPVADYLYHPQGLQSDEHHAHQRRIVERVLKFNH